MNEKNEVWTGPKTLNEHFCFYKGQLAGINDFDNNLLCWHPGLSVSLQHVHEIKESLIHLADGKYDVNRRNIADPCPNSKNDWRIGLSVKPIISYPHGLPEPLVFDAITKELHTTVKQEGPWHTIQVHPDGFANIQDTNGVFLIESRLGSRFLAPAYTWMTASPHRPDCELPKGKPYPTYLDIPPKTEKEVMTEEMARMRGTLQKIYEASRPARPRDDSIGVVMNETLFNEIKDRLTEEKK